MPDKYDIEPETNVDAPATDEQLFLDIGSTWVRVLDGREPIKVKLPGFHINSARVTQILHKDISIDELEKQDVQCVIASETEERQLESNEAVIGIYVATRLNDRVRLDRRVKLLVELYYDPDQQEIIV